MVHFYKTRHLPKYRGRVSVERGYENLTPLAKVIPGLVSGIRYLLQYFISLLLYNYKANALFHFQANGKLDAEWNL